MNDGFNFVLILDDGHGWETKGKQSPFKDSSGQTQLPENEFNTAMVNKISALAFMHEIPTHILTPEHYDVSLKTRVDRINALAATYRTKGIIPIVLSCHADAFGDPRANGSTVFYYAEGTYSFESRALASELIKKLNDCIDVSNQRGAKRAGFYIIKYAEAISVLIEFAFMTNPDDLRALKSDQVRNQWAENIVLFFIDEYYNISSPIFNNSNN